LRWCKEFKLIKYVLSGKLPRNFKRVSLLPLEKFFMSVFIFIRCISLGNIIALYSSYNNRAKIIELYVSAWLVIFCVLLFTIGSCLSTTVLILVLLLVMCRLIEGVNYLLCIIFVDRYKRSWHPHSPNRSILILSIYYIQVIIGFAILYLATGSIRYSECKNIITKPWEALYFSTVTITTLGYGDMRPINQVGQILVIFEPLIGIVLIVLVFGIFLTSKKNGDYIFSRFRIKRSTKIKLSRRYRRWRRR